MIDFDEMISKLNHRHIYVQTHNFPDPDAIASAYGLQYLLRSKGLESTIVYKGKVEHGSSNAMVKKLGIEIVEYCDMAEMAKEAEIILVDSQKGNANIEDMPGDEVVCIDHHPVFGTARYAFSDIRPEVGACASMIAQYIFEDGIRITSDVATALLYGIKIDTANLTRGVSNLDLDMFYRLYNLADRKKLTELDRNVMRQSDLKAYASAINSIKMYGKTAFANAGYNCQDPLIAAISDFIMMLDTTDNTVVYSVKDDGIKISVRSSGSINAGKAANTALEGIGGGGGHENMAGGFVAYDKRIPDPVHNEKYISELTNEIEQRFANAISEKCRRR